MNLYPQECERLLAALPSYCSDLATALLTLYHTGLRGGELLGLQWQDVFVNGEARTLLVLPAGLAKNGRKRLIPLASPLQRQILAHWEWCKAENSATPPGHWPFIPGYLPKAWSLRWLEKLTARVGANELNRHLKPHMLRHTWATRMLKLTDLRTIQVVLGHSNLNSTQIYTHPQIDDIARVMERAANESPREADLEFPLKLVPKKEPKR